MIELAKGVTSMHPMATFISFDPYIKLLEHIIQLIYYFHSKKCPIWHTKIEILSNCYAQLKDLPDISFVYIEDQIRYYTSKVLLLGALVANDAMGSFRES
jgi:hypothetical protein